MTDDDTGLDELYVFGSHAAADEFIAGLPQTRERADKIWDEWFGDHGRLPPYGMDGGPFNTACFSNGTRDCRVHPQQEVGFPTAPRQQPLPSPLPVTDPLNISGWLAYAPLWDEFDGDQLDPTIWSTDPHVVGWVGRQPGLFDGSNIDVRNSKLTMRARAASWPNTSWPTGFGNFTTSAIHSINQTAHGYFEVRSRSGSSSISSSFWFHQNDGAGTWTEIDVFESTGVSSKVDVDMNSTVFCSHTHIFTLAGVKQSGGRIYVS